MSTHTPRKKKRAVISNAINNGTTSINAQTKHEQPAFPLASFFWPLKGGNISEWTSLPCILMIVFLFRWCTALWGYSGYKKPPMHGDFEAQRHWLELTTNLPITHWYFHDLEWWGLDYPPLTAYHSWLLGTIGNLISPTWFELYKSRGSDDPDLKIFMRSTAVISEYLIYVPAVVVCLRRLARLERVSRWDLAIALTAILMQPATILIDHGHFQYNTVMLGFMIASLSSMLAGRSLWSCVFFVASLGFKQMALFYAPAVAAYLAGSCLFPKINLTRFVGIAIITLLSFAALFLPLILGTASDLRRNAALPIVTTTPPLLGFLSTTISGEHILYPYLYELAQAVHRIFPFARGLFEDKVANVWCAIHASGVHKLNVYPADLLSKAALAATLASILPPCLIIFARPQRTLVPYALATCAWGFFLFSYQVHEKNVLLPLLPMTLLLASHGGMHAASRAWIGFANIVGCWTLFPLLVKDELRIPYFVLTGLWAYLLGIPPLDFKIYLSTEVDSPYLLTKLIHVPIYAGMVAWHFLEAFVPPPAGKPDLWIVANVCLGAGSFGLCYLWCLWRLSEESGLLSMVGLGPKRDLNKKTQ